MYVCVCVCVCVCAWVGVSGCVYVCMSALLLPEGRAGAW